MNLSVDDAVERIDGTRKSTGCNEDDGVFGWRSIGLKKTNSVFKESGDEQSLGVSDDEQSKFSSDPAGFELVEVDVGVFDPDVLVIFDRKLMPRLKADLKMLLYFWDDEDPSFFEELPEDIALK